MIFHIKTHPYTKISRKYLQGQCQLSTNPSMVEHRKLRFSIGTYGESPSSLPDISLLTLAQKSSLDEESFLEVLLKNGASKRNKCQMRE
jgi:hypothetical protein